MDRVRRTFDKAARWLGGHVPRTLRLVLLVAVLGFGYWFLREQKVDADTVAAVASALAALGALEAARESRGAARDSTRALALATKPQPVMGTQITNSQTSPTRGSFAVTVENLGVHPMAGGTLTWLLRDGTAGSLPVPYLGGRTAPSVGMFHKAEQAATYVLAEAFDDGIAGVDRVALTYWGENKTVRWQRAVESEYELNLGQSFMREMQHVPATTRTRLDKTPDTEV